MSILGFIFNHHVAKPIENKLKEKKKKLEDNLSVSSPVLYHVVRKVNDTTPNFEPTPEPIDTIDLKPNHLDKKTSHNISKPNINSGTKLPKLDEKKNDNFSKSINVDKEKKTTSKTSIPTINKETIKKDKRFDPRLTSLQKSILLKSESIAKRESKNTSPFLLETFEEMGYTKKDLDKVLKYIREEAPLNLSFSPDEIIKKDNNSPIDKLVNGLKNITDIHKKNAKTLIDSFMEDGTFKNKEDTHYGSLNLTLNYDGNKSIAPRCYDGNKSNGPCYFVLKNSVKDRTIFKLKAHGERVPGLPTHKTGTTKYMEGVLMELHYKHAPLNSSLNKSLSMSLYNIIQSILVKPNHASMLSKFIQAQYQGPIDFSKDIEYLVIDRKYENTPYEKKLRTFAKKYNIPLKWSINKRLLLDDKTFKNNIRECDINPNSDSTNIIPNKKILFGNKTITDHDSLDELKKYDYMTGDLTIENMDLRGLVLPKIKYNNILIKVNLKLYIEYIRSFMIRVSSNLDYVVISDRFLNSPHEEKMREFAKNNNLAIKWQNKYSTLMDDKEEYKLSSITPIKRGSALDKTILRKNIIKKTSIESHELNQFRDGEYCVLDKITIHNRSTNTAILPKFSYLAHDINVRNKGDCNLVVSKNLDYVRAHSYYLSNDNKIKQVREFAKKNNLSLKWSTFQKTLVDDEDVMKIWKEKEHELTTSHEEKLQKLAEKVGKMN